MKKNKLVVRKEQLRVLDRLDLQTAAGADPASALCYTVRHPFSCGCN